MPTLHGPIEPIEYPKLPEITTQSIKVDAQPAVPSVAVDVAKPSAPLVADAPAVQGGERWPTTQHPPQQQPSHHHQNHHPQQSQWNPWEAAQHQQQQSQDPLDPQHLAHHARQQPRPQQQLNPPHPPVVPPEAQQSPSKQQWDPQAAAADQSRGRAQQEQRHQHPQSAPRQPAHRASLTERTSPRKASRDVSASDVDSSGAPFVLPTIKRVPSVVDLVDEEKQDFIRRIDQLEHQHPAESVKSTSSNPHHRGIEAEDELARSIQQHEREEELEEELRQLQQQQQQQQPTSHGDMRSIEEIAVLEIELDSLKSRLSSEAQTVAELKAELESVAPRMSLLEGELAAKDELVQSLQRQLDAKASGPATEELELMLEATRNSEEALRAELKASSADLEAVEKKLVGKEKRVKELEGQIHEKASRLERTEGQLKDILGLLTENGDEIDADDVVPAVKAMIEQRARAEEQLDLLRTHVDLTETQVEELAAEKAEWEPQRKKMLDEIAGLKKENERLLAENANLVKENQNLAKQKEQSNQKHEQKATTSPTSVLPSSLFKGSDEDSAAALFQSALQESKATNANTATTSSSSGTKSPPSVIPSDIWGSTTSTAAAAWPFTPGSEREETLLKAAVPERSHSGLEQPKQQPCLSTEAYIKSTGDLDAGVFVDAAKEKVVEALRQELHQKDLRIKSLQEELEALKLKQDDNASDEEDVESLIELAKDEIVELRAELADKDQIIDRLNEQLNALFATAEAVKENQANVESSTEEANALKAHIAKLEAHREQLSQFITTKLSENAERLDRLGSLQGSIEQACTTIEGPRVRELEAMVARLKADLAAASRKEELVEKVLLEEKGAEIERLRAGLERLESTHQEQSEFIETQLKMNGEKLNHLEQLQGSIEGAYAALEGSRVNELESKMVELKSHVAEMEGALEDPRILSDLRGQYEKHSARFTSIKDSNEDRLHRLESLQSRILAVCDALDGDKLSSHFTSGLEPTREALIHLREAVIHLLTKLDELHAERTLTSDAADDPNTEEHKMIMAAWHDLGMKLMRMNYHAVHHPSS